MAGKGAEKNRQGDLQQAASVIFAMVAVVPLLLFAWAIFYLKAVQNIRVLVALGLALLVALLGYYMFRVLLSRMSEMVQALSGAVERASQPHRAEPRPASPDAAASTPRPSASAAPALPGIGSVRELGEAAHTIALLWQTEARAHLGRRVLVSVANASEPIVGTLSDVTDDGLLLEQDGQAVAIGYRRIRAIEGDAAARA